MSSASDFFANSYLGEPSGFNAWFTTRDHKRVGLMYLGWTLGVLLLGMMFEILLVVKSLGGMGSDPAAIFRVLTYQRLLLVFMFLAPVIPSTLGYFLLPLQLGARNLTFPSASIWSLRLYVLGLLCVLGSYIFGAVAGGWTLATPLSLVATGTYPLLALGLALVGVSWVLTGVNFLATVHHERVAGLGFFDLPLLSWGLYLGAYLLTGTGILLAVIVIYLVAGRSAGHGPFGAGSDPLAWQNYFWFVTRPAAYFALIPATGVIFDVVAGISRKAVTGYRLVVGSLIALLAMSVTTWGIHLADWGQPPQVTFVFSVLSVLVIIPVAILAYCLLATLYRGSVACAAPTTFTVAFLLHTGIAVAMSLFLGSPALGSYLGATMFATAQLNYVLWGGVLAALLAGLNYWWPKLTGHSPHQTIGRVGGFLYVIGVNLMLMPQVILGVRGVPANLGPFEPGPSGLSEVSGLGLLLLFFGIVVEAANFIGSLASDRKLPADPWGAAGREWTVPSPPPTGNFASTGGDAT